jgi:site-specific recombinase XerD
MGISSHAEPAKERDSEAQELSVVATPSIPPILAGHVTPDIRERVEQFYLSGPLLLEGWIKRCRSAHTRRCYREDVLQFVHQLGLAWPTEAHRLWMTTVRDVQAYRDWLLARNAAPKTINRRISSLSGFYKYVGGAAAELRLPISIPNPAHAQFVGRSSSDPVEETRALTAARDRSILKLYLYSGIRLATGCRLRVEDFEEQGGEATLRLREKGDKRRTIGLHSAAAQALASISTKLACVAGHCSGPSALVLGGRSQIAPCTRSLCISCWRAI